MSLRSKLEDVASNFWWCWTPRAAHLFERVDPNIWEDVNHSPLALLRRVTDEQIAAAFPTPDDVGVIHSVLDQRTAYLSRSATWTMRKATPLARGVVAYLCAEFGIHESLPTYSGGLGVLAGDHLKTASDLGLPLVAVGLKYPEGFFRQSLSPDGLQHESYPMVDWSVIPARRVEKNGAPLQVDVPMGDGLVHVGVWRLDIGRTVLFLLDTDIAANSGEDRAIGGRLYSGDSAMRIRQEIVLGIGAVRALRAMEIAPSAFHLNEGHSAFACLELLREQIAAGASFDDALSRVREQVMFTTHTPVAAGHDRFKPELFSTHLRGLIDQIGLDEKQILALGREDADDEREHFCMTVLALRATGRANAVASLHGATSRHMWHSLWPARPEDQVPIGHVTNGVHVETFMHPRLRALLDDRCGSDWPDALLDPARWDAIIDGFDEDELVSLKRRLKLDMFERLAARPARHRGAGVTPPEWLGGAAANWKTDVLTLGFARRFATYKRGSFLFTEIERARALFSDPERPIQIVFAGKAHPQDIEGKAVIRDVVHAASYAGLGGRIVFVEDYDLAVARALVSGVDVWLNTPRRPREASGTSGQKVSMHLGLNASILDGWWAEGYDGNNGFAIGDEVVPDSPETQDARDYLFLMQTVRHQIVPSYYAPPGAGSSHVWVARMRAALRTLTPRFSSRRMLRDYILQYYLPIANRAPLH